jgi:putative aminopeptidase FrvX
MIAFAKANGFDVQIDADNGYDSDTQALIKKREEIQK